MECKSVANRKNSFADLSDLIKQTGVLEQVVAGGRAVTDQGDRLKALVDEVDVDGEVAKCRTFVISVPKTRDEAAV